MWPVLASVSALILSLFILLAGNSLQFVILALRAEAEDFSLLTIGLMTAGYYFGYAAGALQAPRIVAMVGHIRAFATACSIISGVVLAHALWVEPWFWIFLRVLTGLCFAAVATTSESWLNARATHSVRGRVLAISVMAVTLGYAIGPMLTLMASVDGFVLFVVASILMSVALVPVAMTRMAAPTVSMETTTSGYSPMRLYRETPLGLVGAVGIGAAQGAFLGLGAIFARQLGLGPDGASAFVTGALLVGMAAQFPLAWASDRTDRRRVIAGATLVVAAAAVGAMLLLSVGAGGIGMAVLTAAVGGLAAMPLYAVVIAYANDRLPEHSIVPAAATLILCFSVGSVIGSPIASTLMEVMGPPGLMLFLAVIMASLGLFALYRMTQTDAPIVVEGEETSGIAATVGLFPMDMGATEAQLEFDFDASEPQSKAG